MILAVLALASQLTWTPIADKRALLCPLSQLNQCLAALPTQVLAQLPAAEQVKQDIGWRSAMVLPVEDPAIAGVIITSANNTPQTQQITLDNHTYQFPLIEQTQLTLWHELGHLENIALQGSILPAQLTSYQHEWLADTYLIWRVAHEKSDLTLAWQQYHRRNLAALTNSAHMSHWSAPMMIQVLDLYEPSQIVKFAHYRDFLADFYPKAQQPTDYLLTEYSSLMQRTFGASVTQPLPKYLFWRKSALGAYLKPTLVFLMGEAGAKNWLIQNSML